MGSRVETDQNEHSSSYTGPKKRRVSTAHIQTTYDINGTLAYDQFVSTCSEFLGSSSINTTVTQFADNILAILSSPITLEESEVKRRIEQILPTDRTYKHYRGTKVTDKDCTLLCSLADRIVNLPPAPDHQQEHNYPPKSTTTTENVSVHYIRHEPRYVGEQIPKHFPNFVEPNTELGENISVTYDMDVTPYDSEAEDTPIKIK